MPKQNITQYSDDELSMMFSNDEFLYGEAVAATDFDTLESLADELYTYTPDQLRVFKNDFEDGGF